MRRLTLLGLLPLLAGACFAAAPVPRVAAPAAERPVSVLVAPGIGEHEYRVTRDTLEGQLSRLQELAAQARIVPHFQGGRALGFKLFAIRPESLYAKLGLHDGDHVRRVNGIAIDGPDEALAAYGLLRSASEIVVDLVRAGRNVTLTYLIR
jgi:general secretion pathway protein C